MARAELAMSFAETTVEWAQEKLELTDEEVGQAVGVSRKTVQRWKDRESAPSPQHRKHLEQLNQLRYLLETSFRNIDAAQRWMHAPLAALRGRTPHFALVEGDVEALVKILATLAAGAHR